MSAAQPEMSRADLFALCKRAGVLPSEIMDHPTHGLVLSAPGALKLAALAPDTSKNMRMREAIRALIRDNGKDSIL